MVFIMNQTFKTAEEFIAYAQNPENWIPTQKVAYEMWAKRAPIGQEVYNGLENADYTAKEGKDIVLSGTAGEQWVVSEEKLRSTYRAPDGNTSITLNTDDDKDNGWTKIASKADAPGHPTVYAIQIPVEIVDFVVETAWGTELLANHPYASDEMLGHGEGDYMLAEIDKETGGPNLNDLRVVNHDIFVRTYDMSNFPNEKQGVATAPPAPTGFVTRDELNIDIDNNDNPSEDEESL